MEKEVINLSFEIESKFPIDKTYFSMLVKNAIENKTGIVVNVPDRNLDKETFNFLYAEYKEKRYFGKVFTKKRFTKIIVRRK